MRLKCAIIGAGPGGISCGIQLKRYGVDFKIFEGNKIGGLAINANKIMNYLGFPSGINGPAFCNLLKEQIEGSKIDLIYEKINWVNYDQKKEIFTLDSDKNHHTAKILVVATGSKPMTPGFINSENNSWVYYDIDQIRKIENKELVIIGGGDLAFDYALTLAKQNKVTILNRSEEFCALDNLIKEVQRNNNIKIKKNLAVQDIIKNQTELVLELNGGVVNIRCDYLIIAVGREPKLDILSAGLIKIKKDLVKSKKLYIIGDASSSYFRQISIASGEGMKTAMEIFRNYQGSVI